MNNFIFVLIGIAMGLIVGFPGIWANLRNFRRLRYLMRSEAEKVEREFLTDFQEIGYIELQQTKAGRELLVLGGKWIQKGSTNKTYVSRPHPKSPEKPMSQEFIAEAETLNFINPATGVIFGEIKMTTAIEVKNDVDDMRKAFAFWSSKSVKERVLILRKFQTLLIDYSDFITEVLNQAYGKSRQEGLIELFATVDILAQYCAQAPKWLGRKFVSSSPYLFKQSFIEYHPHGVVAVIASWKNPLKSALPAVVAGLLAGNTVIFKPSEVPAAIGVLIERLIKAVPELAPFVRIVHGGGKVEASLTQAKPDYIFVAGSTPTRKEILQAASEHLIPVGVELGGKDAMIVLDDADIDAAAYWGTRSAFSTTSQTSMTIERVYVVESKYDEFVLRCIHYSKMLKIGYSKDANNPYIIGPVVDPRHVKIIEKHLEDAILKGARVLTGGKERGLFYSPIVIVDVNHTMPLIREETLGPIMPIMKVDDASEAIQLANDSEFGFGVSVWGQDIARAKGVANQIDASSVRINNNPMQFGCPTLPFGAIKDSSFRRAYGQEGLMQFTRPLSYAVGNVPIKWNLTTILREKIHYDLATLIMGVIYGTSLKQRFALLTKMFRKKSSIIQSDSNLLSEPLKKSE